MKKIPVGSYFYFVAGLLWLFLAFTEFGNWSTRVYIALFFLFLVVGIINWRMTDRANKD
ncbi:hypothetical protein JCM9140_3578 [Halalkalibacter wakoensis JCM 9140]|uniref:Uncharacterized protein n=1 Tax=Halalkalibacter wakoensis JCM 9140 TaxID=1236970 RepID=W4Q5V0_9BACI|nr:hypothetical protein [Halalkalibacter wakoensis]GAE27431.1 hypothetical protein JCM9140_3578 [Halalkalibacter wakoensis JCM 9140]